MRLRFRDSVNLCDLRFGRIHAAPSFGGRDDKNGSRTYASDSEAEASAATGNLRQAIAPPGRVEDTKIEDCPSLDAGRCGIPLVSKISRFRVMAGRFVRLASVSATVPAEDACRYSNCP